MTTKCIAINGKYFARGKGSSALLEAMSEWYDTLDDEHKQAVDDAVATIVSAMKSRKPYIHFGPGAGLELLGAMVANLEGWTGKNGGNHVS